MSDLVKRIRNRVNDSPMDIEKLLDEAADRMEAMEKCLSAGPVGYLYEMRRYDKLVSYGFEYAKNRRREFEFPTVEQPLYFIPAPEPKP